jgi:hypothetical protein
MEGHLALVFRFVTTKGVRESIRIPFFGFGRLLECQLHFE